MDTTEKKLFLLEKEILLVSVVDFSTDWEEFVIGVFVSLNDFLSTEGAEPCPKECHGDEYTGDIDPVHLFYQYL